MFPIGIYVIFDGNLEFFIHKKNPTFYKGQFNDYSCMIWVQLIFWEFFFWMGLC